MFKKIKAFLIMLLVIPFAFMFSACKDGNDNGNGGNGGENSGGQEQPGTGDDSGGGSTDPDDPVVIIENYTIEVDYKFPEKFKFLAENITETKQTTEKFELPVIDESYAVYFEGWYDASTNEKITDTEISGTKDQTISVYAKWKETEFKTYFSCGGLTYSLDMENQLATVNGYDEKSEIIVIPTAYKADDVTYSVSAIGNACFSGDTKVKEVISYARYLEVKDNAFSNSVIEKFDFETVDSLGNNAFASTKITTAKFAPTFDTIGTGVFANCTELAEVDFSKVVNEINILPVSTFENCLKLEAVKLVPTMSVISTNSFKNCVSLADAEFLTSDSLSEIQTEAFLGCTSLNNVVIGKNVTTIGYDVFDSCTGLKKMTVNRLFYNEIGDNFSKFYGSLENILEELIITGENVVTIENDYFVNYTALKTFVMNDTIVGTGTYVFDGCVNLENITFSDAFDMSGFVRTAFEDTLWYKNQSGYIVIENVLIVAPGNIEEIVIPDGVEVVSERVFYGNNVITSVKLPASVKEIAKTAFSNCKQLKTVEFAEGSLLETIGNNAFYKCSKLTSINLERCINLTSIGNNAFYGISEVETLVIPASVETIGTSPFAEAEIQNIQVATGNIHFVSEDGVLFEIDNLGNKVALVTYLMSNVNISYTIPSTVTEVYKKAFMANASLKYVFVMDNEISFASDTFMYCDSVMILTNDISKVSGIKTSGGYISYVEGMYEYIDTADYSVVADTDTFEFTFNLADVSNSLYYVQFEYESALYTYIMTLSEVEDAIVVDSYLDISDFV